MGSSDCVRIVGAGPCQGGTLEGSSNATFSSSITDLPTWARSPSLSPAEAQEGGRG